MIFNDCQLIYFKLSALKGLALNFVVVQIN